MDTPNLAFSLLRTGEYRIEVKPDSSTTLVTVRGGQGELQGPNQALTVRAGEQAQVVGADQPTYQTVDFTALDAMDTWSGGAISATISRLRPATSRAKWSATRT